MGFCFAVSFYFSCNNKVSICNSVNYRYRVVVATAKVQIFKQITTPYWCSVSNMKLLLLPQRYKFSSKSQRSAPIASPPSSCCCYRKGTNFQANHNARFGGCPQTGLLLLPQRYKFSSKSQLGMIGAAIASVVVATAKVQIFKQITTHNVASYIADGLLLLPQRYKFSSKSQLFFALCRMVRVVVATAKVQIFKQITTNLQ